MKVLIRLPEVQKRTGLSRTGIYEQIRKGNFPPRIKIGTRAIAFSEKAVESWINDRIEEAENSIAKNEAA